MKIIFDIMHPAHLNFFKNSIFRLAAKGHVVKIIVLNRGRVPSIVKKELKGFDIEVIGLHTGSKYSIIFQANLFRIIKLMKTVLAFSPQVGFSVGSFVLGFNMKILNKKNYQFDDDPERKANVFLEKLTSTRLFFPKIYESNSKKITQLNTLKEWSYLSPKYFRNNLAVLKSFGIKPKTYIFVREISTGSLNYKNQRPNLISEFASELDENYRVIFSLENKSDRHLYPESWILLQEPVADIHSLMYNSSLIISSGDSMAREGAMLGVPSIYCGERIMKANKVLQDKKMLLHLTKDIPVVANRLLTLPASLKTQDVIREELLLEWIDVNDLIISLVEDIE
jgi:predicted glycosyltransferase